MKCRTARSGELLPWGRTTKITTPRSRTRPLSGGALCHHPKLGHIPRVGEGQTPSSSALPRPAATVANRATFMSVAGRLLDVLRRCQVGISGQTTVKADAHAVDKRFSRV